MEEICWEQHLNIQKLNTRHQQNAVTFCHVHELSKPHQLSCTRSHPSKTTVRLLTELVAATGHPWHAGGLCCLHWIAERPRTQPIRPNSYSVRGMSWWILHSWLVEYSLWDNSRDLQLHNWIITRHGILLSDMNGQTFYTIPHFNHPPIWRNLLTSISPHTWTI